MQEVGKMEGNYKTMPNILQRKKKGKGRKPRRSPEGAGNVRFAGQDVWMLDQKGLCLEPGD